MKIKPSKGPQFWFNSRPTYALVEELKKIHPDHHDDIDRALAACPEPEPEPKPKSRAKKGKKGRR